MMALNKPEDIDLRELCFFLYVKRRKIGLTVLLCLAIALIFLFFTRNMMTFRYRVALSTDTPVTWSSCPTGNLECRQAIISRPFMRSLPPGYRKKMSFDKDSALVIELTEKKANKYGIMKRLRTAERQERLWYLSQAAHPSRQAPTDMMVTETWARLYMLTDSVVYAADFDQGELKMTRKFNPLMTLLLAVLAGLTTSSGYLLLRKAWDEGATPDSVGLSYPQHRKDEQNRKFNLPGIQD